MREFGRMSYEGVIRVRIESLVFFFSFFNIARSYSFITLAVLSFNLLLYNFEHGQ